MRNPTNTPKTVCAYAGGRFEVSEQGVHYFGKDNDGKELPAKLVCSLLHIVAKTRDGKNGEWGRLLKWRDDDGHEHQWAMPVELLEGDGSEVRRELARLGLHISQDQRSRGLLAAYIKLWPVEDRAYCVDRLGWHSDLFVTPSGAIGKADTLVVFQNAHAIEPAYAESGTVDEWRESVAALAQGNSRLILAISIAFGAALADIAGEDSGGFHFRGASSSGKSTALKLAASVWGNPSTYVRLWRGTVNGLEGLAALHNDGLLILDEIGQIDPADAGDAAYMLANGQGKARANRNGLARAAQRWRLLFLSAGEESLSALMARAGKKASAGQEIRLADIEADAGVGMGMFEALHDLPGPAALASAIKEAAGRYYGAVGRNWLGHLVEDRANLKGVMTRGIERFVDEVVPRGAAGQVERVARRFALVGVAGELASLYGLTGWPPGEAIQAVKTCFGAWLSAYGPGNREEHNILAHVRGFFEMHGASRFERIDTDHEQRVQNRAGFYDLQEDGGRKFYVLPEVFRREICQGYDEKQTKKALMEAGMLIPAKDGKPTQVHRLPGLGTTRAYVVRYLGQDG